MRFGDGTGETDLHIEYYGADLKTPDRVKKLEQDFDMKGNRAPIFSESLILRKSRPRMTLKSEDWNEEYGKMKDWIASIPNKSQAEFMTLPGFLSIR